MSGYALAGAGQSADKVYPCVSRVGSSVSLEVPFKLRVEEDAEELI